MLHIPWISVYSVICSHNLGLHHVLVFETLHTGTKINSKRSVSVSTNRRKPFKSYENAWPVMWLLFHCVDFIFVHLLAIITSSKMHFDYSATQTVTSKERVGNSWDILKATLGHDCHKNHSGGFVVVLVAVFPRMRGFGENVRPFIPRPRFLFLF